MFDLGGQGALLATLSSLIFPLTVIFCAYLVRGIAGFGSALIAVPLLALSMPLTLVVPLVVFLDYLGSATQGINDNNNIAWHDIWPLLPFSLIGVAVSLYIMESINPHILTVCLGAFILVFAVYQLLPLNFGQASNKIAAPAGFFGGFVGTLFGTGGPFYVIYLNLRKLDKTSFRATFAAIFMIDGAMRLFGYAIKGFYNLETFMYLVAALPVAGLGMFIGGKIHTALGRDAFVRLISVLLLGSGSALIFKGR
jgi:uncharacterized membrane protein YfcA